MNVNTAHNSYTEILHPMEKTDSPVLSVEQIMGTFMAGITVSDSKKKQNVRAELLNQLYDLYLSECERTFPISNKKRYYAYIRLHHPTALAKKEEYNSHKNEFRSAKLPDHKKFLKPIKSNDYLWWGRFSHLKGEEGNECLSLMVSEAKDISNRKGNVIAYILGASGKLGLSPTP